MIGAGSLVEIHSLPAKLQANEDTRRRLGPLGSCDFNGAQGRCLHWDDAGQQYAVHTFDGAVVGVPAECLCELRPTAPAAGGFDAAWQPEEPDSLGVDMADALATRGYAVVQMFVPAAVRDSAVEEARELPVFDGLRAELRPGLLGRGGPSECREMDADSAERPIDGALVYCDRQLTGLGMALKPMVEDLLGTAIEDRSGSLVRLGGAGSAAPELEELSENDLVDQVVESFVAWTVQRKLCVLYLIDNRGGSLDFHPRETSVLPAARLPLQRGRLVVFRHDELDFSYNPEGDSVALQMWLLQAPSAIEFRELSQPPGLQGVERIHVASIYERFPANCDGCAMTWAMFLAGTDAEGEVPFKRFDKDVYVMEDKDAIMYGKAYIMHGSFVEEHHMTEFDNEFFGISHDEAFTMAPSQRWVMECGYQTLHSAGWRRNTLRGQRIGTFMGDSGSEWQEIPMVASEYAAAKNNNAVTITRLAYNLGLTGPCLTVDTACSASLVAANAACHAMRRWTFRKGSTEPVIFHGHDRPSLEHALCMGILAMVSPSAWIGECAATMLSPRGRCFTFDNSADGFIRGEGCCCVYLRTELDEQVQLRSRPLAVVMGTCANQDGRSASLTAPHGPSQQECIRQCLREAGLQPAEVMLGECHGTGTALGDPIEVGSVRGVMFKHRENAPITHVTAKAHVGHEEANAGVCGLIKIILMLNAATVTPNPHLKALNAHLDVNGYPVIFNNEPRHTQLTDQVFGVSSFGFGGTNSRAECWADVDKGAGRDGVRTVLSREEALDMVDWACRGAGAPGGTTGCFLPDEKPGHL